MPAANIPSPLVKIWSFATSLYNGPGFPMFVTDSYDTFVVYMTFACKTTDVRANNVKHLRMAEALLRLASHRIQRITYVFKQ